MVKSRLDRNASTATGYAWIVWEKGFGGPVWIPPWLAGIRTSSHSGRRTFATRLHACGVMRTIQKLMGHKHISTTALYCEVSDDMLRNAVELVSGR